MSLSPWQWVAACAAAFMMGMSKTGIAGISALGVAVFATVLPSKASVGVVLVVLICADVVAVLSFRRLAVWSHLWRLFPWTVAGVVLGCLVLGKGNEQEIRRLIGAILLAMVCLQFYRDRSGPKTDKAVRPPQGLLWVGVMGLLAGFTTMVSNAAGPIMILYLLAAGLPKMEFMGTSAIYFFIMNLFKMPFSVGLGLIQFDSLKVDLWLVPWGVTGALLGRYILKMLNQRVFENLALGLTLVASLKLLLF